MAVSSINTRVSGFVGGTKDRPLPISEDDVNNIINRIEVGEDALHQKLFMNLVKLFEFAMVRLMTLMVLLSMLIMKGIS